MTNDTNRHYWVETAGEVIDLVLCRFRALLKFFWKVVLSTTRQVWKFVPA